ncbi:hypothetical protein K439DRAFT_1618688 [Ramaria rubella]|nr:hypothetical protein K439DRAFT_1618688 [Ramaria rubella]
MQTSAPDVTIIHASQDTNLRLPAVKSLLNLKSPAVHTPSQQTSDHIVFHPQLVLPTPATSIAALPGTEAANAIPMTLPVTALISQPNKHKNHPKILNPLFASSARQSLAWLKKSQMPNHGLPLHPPNHTRSPCQFTINTCSLTNVLGSAQASKRSLEALGGRLGG